MCLVSNKRLQVQKGSKLNHLIFSLYSAFYTTNNIQKLWKSLKFNNLQ